MYQVTDDHRYNQETVIKIVWSLTQNDDWLTKKC